MTSKVNGFEVLQVDDIRNSAFFTPYGCNFFFFFQAEDGIRDVAVTGVQTCALPIFLKLGALADFLSKPILVGFLNGIALSIILGQIGKIFGYSITKGGIVPRLTEFIEIGRASCRERV